ncbi:hypothetical protein K470DRAFT_264764 [Piedraia hortae CBS 480.64]|uniref:Uncharacterized protein n=1 Tax=Piedraia hortae CBS 480.64 TaxID=1314780 RepID=A0A6A7BXM5_9PEZI|nr:hypothetical protein K470DRAFT_264764 [Piedraia hortae CBS 480.64]
MQLHLLTLLTTLLCLFGVEAGKKHEAFKYGIWITGYGNDNCEDPPRLKRENALHGHCTTFGKYRGPLTSMRASIMNKWDLADRCRIWFYSDKNCTGKSWYAGGESFQFLHPGVAEILFGGFISCILPIVFLVATS